MLGKSAEPISSEQIRNCCHGFFLPPCLYGALPLVAIGSC